MGESKMITTKIIEKPWGYEEIYAENEKYIGKVLHIKAGHRLSKQYHKVKDETLMLFSGQAYIEYSGERGGYMNVRMHRGYSYRILPGVVHRLSASQAEDADVLEVSTPEGDDVVRLEDDYKRI